MNKENIALIIGGTGSIGSAVANELKSKNFTNIISLSRSSEPSLDLLDESSIQEAAAFIKKKSKPISLLFDATGILHDEDLNQMPEKTYKNIDFLFMKKNFEINVMGPALIIKHFLPLLDTEQKSIFSTLSAKVGSISDNRYGGWYSYRASKAALNQIIKTTSIELKVKNKNAICVAIHPGTVTSKLSKPFQKNNLKIQSKEESAKNIVQILENLQLADSGSFLNWDGSEIRW
jgi:NAD(P)-dependent dehydrogenase (short-subunit alcohol dehydrogenase family)|tara:strand:+ start:1025 stop:1723 length:699 start_codon:yes stop_codon:yes gene_type:complete